MRRSRAEVRRNKNNTLACLLSRFRPHWKCLGNVKEADKKRFRKRRPCRQAKVVRVAQEEWELPWKRIYKIDTPRRLDAVIIIIIMVHLRMQPEGYGAAIYTFELQSLIASSSPQFLLLRCCKVLLFCRLEDAVIDAEGEGRSINCVVAALLC